MQTKGRFIVLYGINNLGKTTQAKKLVNRLNDEGLDSEYLKYPLYQLEPAGKLINDYLRGNNPHNFNKRELQLLHYIDRITYEPILKEKLNQGINIIAEDYFGTAIAWGVASGVSKELLDYLYGFLIKEDIAFLFDGERFKEGIEKNHKHEQDKELMAKSRQIHQQLAKEYNWIEIDANQDIEKIHDKIWEKIKQFI